MTETKNYVRTTWVDELLSVTPAKYDIHDGVTDDPIHDGVTINLADTPTAEGTQVNAARLNNIEAGLEAVGPYYGSWTPVFTGFSVNPGSVVAKYVRIEQLCICFVQMGTGTSNSALFKLTLPFYAQSLGYTWRALTINVDNGAGVIYPGIASIAAGASLIEITKTLTVPEFAPSGAKSAQFNITYLCDPTRPV